MRFLNGDVVYVDDLAYLAGKINDINKIEYQISEYDPDDKLYQISYTDDKNTNWLIWIPSDKVRYRYSYNFWLKKKKLSLLIERRVIRKKSDILSENRTKF